VKDLGVNTYSLVLIWAGLKSLAKLCERIDSNSHYIANYKKSEKEDFNMRYIKNASQEWEEKSIEIKDFIQKYVSRYFNLL